MLTTKGKLRIKQYLAGHVGSIADDFVFGVSGTAVTVNDQDLAFEFANSPISITSYDFVNDRLVFKAELPDNFVGTIYEVGVRAESETPVDSKLLTTFDSDSENWTPATYSASNVRLGIDGIFHTPAAGATSSSVLSDIALDLSENLGSDKFQFVYNVGNGNTSGINVRLRTDASNYYQFSAGQLTAGYKLHTVDKAALTVVGTPTWENITSIEVRTTSGSGGASAVTFDGLRIQDSDLPSDHILVAREVLAAPYVKDNVRQEDFEFDVPITIT